MPGGGSDSRQESPWLEGRGEGRDGLDRVELLEALQGLLSPRHASQSPWRRGDAQQVAVGNGTRLICGTSVPRRLSVLRWW